MRDFQLPGMSTAYGQNGMAATSHPLATLTAIEILKSGGNAIDAAVAANAVQCVVEPQSTGVGGDCFVLYGPASGGVHALNASGWTPAEATLENVRNACGSSIPQTSIHAVTVPGAIAGWSALVEAHGTRPFGDLLEPAIRFAEEGFVVAPRVAWDWQRAAQVLRNCEAGEQFYLDGGEAPKEGSIMRFPVLARTLRFLAEHGAKAFYEGELPERMVRSLRAQGGLHQLADFAEFEPEWVDPINATYRGVRVYECPPNGQGIIALLMLNILETFKLEDMHPSDTVRLHIEAEATRLAFRERDLMVGDPRHADIPTKKLLDKGFARELARSISTDRAMSNLPTINSGTHPDTIYLSVVDKDLNAVSFINSIYDSFGSGRACGDTGVLFHSRGRIFRLEDGHANSLAPRKRPLHTIIPGLAFKEGELWASFGVMGGDYQPVGHARFISSLVDRGLSPQDAVDLPRIMAYPNGVEAESGFDAETLASLRALGHGVRSSTRPLGGGQAIIVDHQRGVLIGGSDPRKDGFALGY